MSWFVGFFTGAFMVVFLIAVAIGDKPTRDDCRAAHPGFDCDLGWVVGEAF